MERIVPNEKGMEGGTIYNRLARLLRHCSETDCTECAVAGCPGAQKFCGIAADAIEELSKPRWISVTERLPDAYKDVMLKFPNNQAVGFVDRDGCWGVYSGDGFYTEVAENEPKPTHWTKKLPEPTKEEVV